MNVTTARPDQEQRDCRPYRIVGLNYVSLYIYDFQKAVDFYSRVFGAPEDEDPMQYGWRMGSTWLTVFASGAGTSRDANPRNTEFAIQVSAPAEVDLLYAALIDAGASTCMAPRDTTMYEPMRFGCVDDPFGVRIDVYCPVGKPREFKAGKGLSENLKTE